MDTHSVPIHDHGRAAAAGRHAESIGAGATEFEGNLLDLRAGRWWWETNAPKECGMHCSIEHGGFEHELKAILGKDADGRRLDGARRGAEAPASPAPERTP